MLGIFMSALMPVRYGEASRSALGNAERVSANTRGALASRCIQSMLEYGFCARSAGGWSPFRVLTLVNVLGRVSRAIEFDYL